MMPRICSVAIVAAALGACTSDTPEPAEQAVPAKEGEAASRTTELGGVKASVSVAPKNLVVGDTITLTLLVEAKPGTTVEMPPYREGIGRFAVNTYVPSERQRPDGATEFKQVYTLRPGTSGTQRIPALRIEFSDANAKPDDETKELLTDELTFEVASVLPEDAATDTPLRPARGKLGAVSVKGAWRTWWPLALGAAIILVGLIAFLSLRKRTRTVARASAYEIAVASLTALAAKGIPEGEAVDGWYVELSGIVRHYLENRYGLRAPELTTEEFLRDARQAADLTREHRTLLSSFLEGCDRVKFAGYSPQEDESRSAFDAARQFVEETKPALQREANA